MPGTLHVVATPIGNLEDMTLRAVRVLREVSLIAAEDTRRTAKLLAHFAISTPTVSYHEHNSRRRLPQLLRRLLDGSDVALVTDAGTPGVSDPGAEFVRACVEGHVPVNPVPGASAPLAAAIASGFDLDPFTIFGFPPSRAKDREEWFRRVAAIPNTFSFFESPHRILRTLSDADASLGKRPICVARETTKVHQEFLRGSSAEVVARLATHKGEFTIVVAPAPSPAPVERQSDEDVVAKFGQLTAAEPRLSRREAIAAVARHAGRPAREVYTVLERAKRGSNDHRG